MRPVRNVFQKLSRTEQRREGVVAYLWSTSQCTPPPPQTHTVCTYCTFRLGRGGGQREDRGATVHEYYSSFAHGGNSSQGGSIIPINE